MPRIVDADADFEGVANEIILPVTSGLIYVGFFNETLARAKKNYARDHADTTETGTPVVGDDFTTFKGNTNFLESGEAETDEMTLIAVMKSQDDPSIGTSHQSLFVSNYDGLKGASLWMMPPTTGGAPNGRIRMSARATASVSATLANASLANWGMFTGTVDAAAVNIYNETLGTTQTAAVVGARDKSTEPFRIGSSHSVSFQGETDIAAAMIFNRVLTSQERADLRTWLNEVYLVDHGIAI